jgi:hypothetical protein
MPGWQYLKVHFNGERSGPGAWSFDPRQPEMEAFSTQARIMNELGANDWEMVSANEYSYVEQGRRYSAADYWFKRPVHE